MRDEILEEMTLMQGQLDVLKRKVENLLTYQSVPRVSPSSHESFKMIKIDIYSSPGPPPYNSNHLHHRQSQTLFFHLQRLPHEKSRSRRQSHPNLQLQRERQKFERLHDTARRGEARLSGGSAVVHRQRCVDQCVHEFEVYGTASGLPEKREICQEDVERGQGRYGGEISVEFQ